MQKKYKDLSEYINDNFMDLIYPRVKGFFCKNRELFYLKSYEIPFVTYSKIEGMYVSSLYNENTDKTYINIRCTICLDISISGYLYGKKTNDYETESLFRYVEVILRTKFIRSFEDVKVVSIKYIDDRKAFDEKCSATKFFVPYMKEEQLDYFAERFLEKVYPEALDKPVKIPVKSIVKKMKLNLQYENLPDGIFGKIYFNNDRNKGIAANTIIVDPNKSFISGVGCERNTIIHECVHWFYHRRYFYLNHLLDHNFSSISCSEVEATEEYSSKYSQEVKWMEWQANSLSPRILIPSRTLKVKFDEYYNWNKLEYENDFVKLYDAILKNLSDFYGVSKPLTRIRLIQAGYTQYIGIDGNGSYLSYTPSKSVCEKNDSFKIDFNDFVFNIFNNALLKKAVFDGKIIYADGFLVINDPKFLTKDSHGYFHLKPEYLNKVDECCIKFKTIFNSKSIEDMYSTAFMCRTIRSGVNNGKNDFVDDDYNSNIIGNSYNFTGFIEDYEEEEEIISNMKGSFMEAFNYLFEYYDVPSENYLAKLSGVSNKTISNIRSSKTYEPKLSTVLGICIGLNLRPRISKKLLSFISVDIDSGITPIQCLYATLINSCYMEDLESWNRHIKEAGFPDDYKIPN